MDLAHFRTFGFVVLRRFFEPAPLAAEIDQVLASSRARHSGKIHFQYVPMMTEETPASLALLDQAEAVATHLLGGAVLPTRAKGVRYSGDTPWHADSQSQLASVGFAAYFEPLTADGGALRVLPGSHRPEFSEAPPTLAADGHAVLTDPGDMIVFDEHLFHASCGGGARRQWRADYLRDPSGSEQERQTRAYFAAIYPADWDGGYDVDRYPSYGPNWLSSQRACSARLEALGVYALAARQEAFARTSAIAAVER